MAQRSRNMAGPVLRGGDVARAVAEAAKIDNPDKEIVVEDHGAYVRIEADGGLIVRQDTISEFLGRRFEIRDLELNLSGFSGFIDTQDDYVRFYLVRSL
jgi:toluene monooxygenase system protein D